MGFHLRHHVLGQAELDGVGAFQVRHRLGRILLLVGDGGQHELDVGLGLHVRAQFQRGRGGAAGRRMVLGAHVQGGLQLQQVDAQLAVGLAGPGHGLSEQGPRFAGAVGTFVQLGQMQKAGRRLLHPRCGQQRLCLAGAADLHQRGGELLAQGIRQLRPGGRRRNQRGGTLGVAAFEAGQRGVDPRLERARIQVDRVEEAVAGVCDPAHVHQQQAIVGEETGIAWLQRQRLAVGVLGLGELAQTAAGQSEVGPVAGDGGTQPHDRLVQRGRLGFLTLRLQRHR